MLTKNQIRNSLGSEQYQSLLESSNWKALEILLFNYLLIAFYYSMIYFFPHFLTYLLVFIFLPGRQLGLAILMHDCSHYSFFKSRPLNEFFGKWFCGAPIIGNLNGYRPYHMEHHRKAGTLEDPDRPIYMNYPVSRDSFKRKIFRDLTGQTGIKTLAILYKMNAGLTPYMLSYVDQCPEKKGPYPFISLFRLAFLNLLPSIIFHSVLALFFIALNRFELILVWPITYLTIYMVYLRIRNGAEHGSTPEPTSLDPRLNTRTTLANFLERLTVAPNYVNFHLEHHLAPSVPSYNLKKLHFLLQEKGLLKGAEIKKNYIEVLHSLVEPKTKAL